MNKDRVKGTIDELVGGTKRKAGELTGDTPLKIKGIVQQGKGKLESTWGKAKDAVNEANQETRMQHNPPVTVAATTVKVKPIRHV